MKRILLVFFSAISVVTAVVYLIGCLTPYIGANIWLPMGILALGFPILLLCLSFLIVIWLFINRKTAFILFICLLLGYKNISSIIGFHPNQVFKKEKSAGTIRILGYNVRNFDGQTNPFDSLLSKRHKILDYIADQDADILCIQDFSEYYNPLLASNLSYLRNKLHYKYYFLGENRNFLTYWNLTQLGIAIFSRYPLKNIQFVKYSGKKSPEGIVTADVTINGITRRIVTTHLQSMWLGNKEKIVPPWDHSEDSNLNYHSKVYQKIDYYLPYHALQANELRKELNKSPYPIILSMDMNEVPSSYCYNKIRGNLADVFLAKGFGFGVTYSTISPTLRIDYLLVDPSISIVQFKCDKIYMSDHYPQVVDVKW